MDPPIRTGSGVRPVASHDRQVRRDRPQIWAAVAALTSSGLVSISGFLGGVRDFFMIVHCKGMQGVPCLFGELRDHTMKRRILIPPRQVLMQ